MVGGKVVGIARRAGSTLVHVRETRGGGRSECSIRVEEKRRSNGHPVSIGLGDTIWWQGRDAMWTPKNGREEDVHIPRIGYSH